MAPDGSSPDEPIDDAPDESRADDSPNGPSDGDASDGSIGSDASDGSIGSDASDEPSDETVVQTAADAAEGVIFSRYARSAVRDYDVTVTFEDGVLEVDIYLNAPEAEGPDEDRVADDAALAGREAVDDLFGG